MRSTITDASVLACVTNQEAMAKRIANLEAGLRMALDDIATWLQRAALLIGLWASAGLLNIAPDKAGEIAAALIKSLK